MDHNQAKLEHLRETALSLHFAAISLLINIEEAENMNREKLGLEHCEASHNKFIALSAIKDRVRQMYGVKYR